MSAATWFYQATGRPFVFASLIKPSASAFFPSFREAVVLTMAGVGDGPPRLSAVTQAVITTVVRSFPAFVSLLYSAFPFT